LGHELARQGKFTADKADENQDCADYSKYYDQRRHLVLQ